MRQALPGLQLEGRARKINTCMTSTVFDFSTGKERADNGFLLYNGEVRKAHFQRCVTLGA